MADITQAGPAGQPAGPAAGAKTLVTRLTAAVAGHARFSLAVIIVLLITTIGVYVYYHGLFFLGPFSKGGRAPREKSDAGSGEAKGDPETDRLIETINHS